jgi:hypothetical protein
VLFEVVARRRADASSERLPLNGEMLLPVYLGGISQMKENDDEPKDQIRHLRELIAALDRRVPQIERVGEFQIARDAAALKKKALKRIAELET